MWNKTNIQTAMRGAVILLLAWGAQTALAGPRGVSTPPDATGTYRYLPPTVAYPSGLDTSAEVSLPPTDSHDLKDTKKLDKTNHLPVKPVMGQKNGKASVVTLEPIDEN